MKHIKNIRKLIHRYAVDNLDPPTILRLDQETFDQFIRELADSYGFTFTQIQKFCGMKIEIVDAPEWCEVTR